MQFPFLVCLFFFFIHSRPAEMFKLMWKMGWKKRCWNNLGRDGKALKTRTKERKKGNTTALGEWEDYPVGGLSPFLLGWHHRLGGHNPAPEHFVMMDGNIRLLWQRPVQTNRHQALIAQRHVSDAQTCWSGRSGWIWRHGNNNNC